MDTMRLELQSWWDDGDLYQVWMDIDTTQEFSDLDEAREYAKENGLIIEILG